MKERKLNRLNTYDYSLPGYYFITICTHNRIPVFGKIKDDKVVLNEIGEIVQSYWQKIPTIYKNVETDEFIIMPDHIHGIIIINVGDANYASQNNKNRNAKFAFPTDRSKMLLSKIIQQFKRINTIEIKKLGYKNFRWQKSYYDRIIRNEKELYNIRNYIKYNSLKDEGISI